jgi:CheY-like chemotaxis protein
VEKNGAGRRVLIVDDEPRVADTLTLIFRGRGYDAQKASSAEQALEVVTSWEPQLAILDVSLPGMNGVELAVVLSNKYPQCRLLLFSGHTESGDLLEAADKGGRFFELVPKPVHPSFLLDWAAQP